MEEVILHEELEQNSMSHPQSRNHGANFSSKVAKVNLASKAFASTSMAPKGAEIFLLKPAIKSPL